MSPEQERTSNEELALIRQMLDAGETVSTVMAITGAPRHIVLAALGEDDPTEFGEDDGASLIPVCVSVAEESRRLLSVLGTPEASSNRGRDAVRAVVHRLIARAAIGVRDAGPERWWVIQAFGDDWLSSPSVFPSGAAIAAPDQTQPLLCWELEPETHEQLERLGRSSFSGDGGAHGVVQHLLYSAADGVRRPGSWERDWVIEALGDAWLSEVEPVADLPFYNDRPRRQL